MPQSGEPRESTDKRDLSSREEKRIAREGVWGAETQVQEVEFPLVVANTGNEVFKFLPRPLPDLAPGVYVASYDTRDDEVFLRAHPIKVDSLIRAPGNAGDVLSREISLFWKMGKSFKDAGFLHRRGFFLYGSQGTGKSYIVQEICDRLVKAGGLVFICKNPRFLAMALEKYRRVNPHRPIVCVFDDIDSLIKDYGEDELLSMLDGKDVVDHVVNIATSNFPELLNRRLVSRPRRFDRLIRIGPPSLSVRRAYVRSKVKGALAEKIVRATANLSFASLAECVVSVCCMGHDLSETVERLEKMESSPPSSNEYKEASGNSIGFKTSSGSIDAEEDDSELEEIDDDDWALPSNY